MISEKTGPDERIACFLTRRRGKSSSYGEFREKVEILAGKKQNMAQQALAFCGMFCFFPAKIEIFREIPSKNEIFLDASSKNTLLLDLDLFFLGKIEG